MNFGEHFTIDGYGGDKNLLNDDTIVMQCLSELSRKLGMSVLSKPQVYFDPGNDGGDTGGWNGVVMGKEEHVVIHTFPQNRSMSVDIHASKNGMDTKFLEDYFKNMFKLEDLETNLIKRGTRLLTKLGLN